MVRPLQDRVLVELEPEAGKTFGGIFRVGHDPVRTGRVIAAGPGKQFSDKFVPTTVKPGDRVCFLQATIETKAEEQLHYRMPEGHVLVREWSLLGVLSETAKVSK